MLPLHFTFKANLPWSFSFQNSIAILIQFFFFTIYLVLIIIFLLLRISYMYTMACEHIKIPFLPPNYCIFTSCLLSFFLFFEIGSHCVSLTDPKHPEILLLLPPEYQDERQNPEGIV